MSIVKAAVLTLLIGTALAAAFISVRYPFTRETVPLLLSQLRKPDIAKPDPTIDTLPKFEAFIETQLADKPIQGASVAIVSDGKVSWQKGYGVANEDGVMVSADTPFMIGSISKAVTGVTLMHAVEAGLIDLDADINDYLSQPVRNPNHPDKPITLRHLATHTSGLIDHDWTYTNSYKFGSDAMPLDQFVRAYYQPDGSLYRQGNFSKDAPSEAYEYSNVATGLAGQVFHEATGVRLDLYAREHIFAPLGMANTGWFLSDFADLSQIAQPYVRGNKPFSHYGYPTWPDGQLRTSANDLARFLAMVMNGGELDGVRILAPETVEQLLTKQTFAGLSEQSGQGIFWEYTKGGLVGHNGGDLGVFAMMYFNPDTNLGAVMLTNATPHAKNSISPVASIMRQITTVAVGR